MTLEAAAKKAARGTLNYLSGMAAEDIVTQHYLASGHVVLARRWRGQAGEIDVVFRCMDTLVFVEVKKADTFSAAAQRLSSAQIRRVMTAAEEFAATQADGPLSPIRIDAALVDASGRVDVIHNVTLD